MSAGPGRGTAGRGAGAGGVAGRGPGRGQTMATHTPDGRELHFTGPPCAICEEMIVGAVIEACGKQVCIVCHHVVYSLCA